MLLLEMIPESIGSAIQCISTGSCVVSPLQGKATGVYVAEDICTTRLVHPAGLPGRETTPCHFAATVKICVFILFFLQFMKYYFEDTALV